MVSSNDVQRLFLQAMFSRRMVTQQLASKIWEKCIAAVKAVNDTLDIEYNDSRASWDAFVHAVNEKLNPLDLEFGHLVDELSGKEMYCLVNRKDDEVAKLATDYTPAEIAYFKNVVEQIMLAPYESYCISSFAALREVSNLKSNMTKTQAELVLASFVARGWLLKSKRGRYSLATRTKLELQTYLKNTYPEAFIECTLCMDFMTRGQACATPQCKARMHDHCYSKYRRSRGNAGVKCPTCGESWSGEGKTNPVGEAAFRDGQDKHKRRTRRVVDEDGEREEDEDEDEDEDEAPSQSQSQSQSQMNPSQLSEPAPSQSQKTRRGKKKAVISDDDDDEDEKMEVEVEEDVKPAKRKSRR